MGARRSFVTVVVAVALAGAATARAQVAGKPAAPAAKASAAKAPAAKAPAAKVAPPAPKPPAPPQPTFDEALAQAAKAGKPLFVDLYTTWCKPCRVFEETVLPRPRMQALLGEVVFVRWDAERDHGLAVARRFDVHAYPTFLVIAPGGELVDSQAGLDDDPEALADWLELAVLSQRGEPAVRARVADGKAGARSLLVAARWYVRQGRFADAEKTLGVAAKRARSDDPARAQIAWDTGALARARAHRARLAKESAAFALAFPTSPQADWAAHVAIFSGELPKAKVHALLVGCITRAGKQAAKLNTLAYEALAVGDLDAAVAAATTATAAAPGEAALWDTLAEAHHYRGERDRALAAADRGLELARTSAPQIVPDLEQNRARFAAGAGSPSADVERALRTGRADVARLCGEDLGGGAP